MTPAILLALLLSQQATPYLDTLEVRINNIDVVVTDRSGKPVAGLTKDDFIVLEDGKAQTLTNFAAYTESAGAAAATAAPSAPQAATAAARTARHFVFIVDEMALHPFTRRKLLASAKELMQKTMQPGDEVMILTPAAEKKIALPFTGDRSAAGAVLEKVIAANGSYKQTQQARELSQLEMRIAMAGGQISPQLMESAVRNAIQDYADSVRRRVEQRLAQVRSIVSSLGGVPGRKSIVLVTTSLPMSPGKDAVDQHWRMTWGAPQVGRDYYDLTPLIDSIAQLAAVNGVTIYSIQAAFNLPDVIGGPDASRQRSSVPAHNWQSDLVQNEAALTALAAPTGGTYGRGDGSVTALFRELASDVTNYYSLGYRAAEEDMDKAHRIEVRVKGHPELRVRARRDVLRKSPGKEMDDMTVAALLRDGVNELGIGAEVGAMSKDNGKVVVPIVVHVPLATLTFLPAANAMQHASFRIHFALLGVRTDFGTGEEREQVLDIPEGEFAPARAKYFTYETKLRVSPGKYRVAVGVFDPVSRLAGFQTMDVEAK